MNVQSKAIKAMIAAAARGLGGPPRLIEWAKVDPKNEYAFWVHIWPRLLPLQIAGSGANGELELSVKVGGGRSYATQVRPHSLLHACASLWIENGMNPKRIQILMGHSTIQMTFDTYGHLFHDVEADQNAAEDIQAGLLGSSRERRNCSLFDFDPQYEGGRQ